MLNNVLLLFTTKSTKAYQSTTRNQAGIDCVLVLFWASKKYINNQASHKAGSYFFKLSTAQQIDNKYSSSHNT